LNRTEASEPDAAALVDLRGFSPQGRILDVGAGGEGVVYRAVQRPIVGLDRSEDEIRELKDRGLAGGVEWVCADARSMPFDDGEFDVVTSFFTLMYIRGEEDKRGTIREMARVLRPGGSAYVWDFALPDDEGVFVGAVEVVLPDGERIDTGYGVRGRGKRQSLEMVRAIVEDAGFRVVEESDSGVYFFLQAAKP